MEICFVVLLVGNTMGMLLPTPLNDKVLYQLLQYKIPGRLQGIILHIMYYPNMVQLTADCSTVCPKKE